MKSPLAALQSNIAELYETPVGFSVEDFLITDLAAIGITKQHQNLQTEETLYILETGDDLDVSLFLDESILECLAKSFASESWDFQDVKDYLLALEGVSHFQYLLWNALRRKSITLFELELQAEVDKYVLTSLALSEQRAGKIPKDLYGYLFDAVQFKEKLSPEVANRYREANHYAGKYCRTLISEYPAQHQQADFLREIRSFYRLPQNEKIRRIESY